MCHVRAKINSEQEKRKEGKKEKQQSLRGNETKGGQSSFSDFGNGVNLGDLE